MEDFELTKKPDMDIFDRRFSAIFDEPIYDPTKMTIIQGTDGVLDDLFSYQVYIKLKNHWRGAVVPADIQQGMIWSETATDKLYHHAAADEEILQRTRSFDVTPSFDGLLIAEYIKHTGDLDTSIRFQDDQMALKVGNIIFINMVEDAPDYLQLLNGKNFIGDTLNADMTVGLTINQGVYDDEALALKSEGDVAHGIINEAETDTYGTLKKAVASEGGVSLSGLTGDNRAIRLIGIYTTDNTVKGGAGVAPVQVDVYKKVGAGIGAQGADANTFAIRSNGSSVWIADEDGDTWQDGEITCASISPLILGAPTELTVDGAGAITVTRGYHTVDGAGDANDDLDTINGGVDGMILVLRAEHPARTITVRDGIDNIELEGGVNCTLDAILDKLYLFYDDGTVPKWVEMSRFTG